MSEANEVDGVVMCKWNRCDVCGRFISYEDFNGEASRLLIDPENEHWETLCAKHAGA